MLLLLLFFISSAVLEQKHCACVFVVCTERRELKQEEKKINKARLSANFDTETIHTKHNLMTD